MRRSARLVRSILVVGLLPAVLTFTDVAAQEELDLEVGVSASVARFTTDLANGGKNCDSAGVDCVGLDVSCANNALGLAGQAIQLNEIKNAPWKAASATFSVSKDVLALAFPELRIGLELADVLKRYFESENYAEVWSNMGEYVAGRLGQMPGEGNVLSEQFGQQVAEFIYSGVVPRPGEPDYVDGTYDHTGCGEIYVAHSIRPVAEGLRMTIVASGDCEGRFPTHPRGLGEWTVLGGLNLRPEAEADESRVRIGYRPVARADYRVEASCP